MNILLVEDDSRISEFIVKGLQENAMHVTLATTGVQARDLLLDQPYDIILLDIMLPGINGIQLTELLRYKKIHTPILILSALSDSSDKVDALDAGADDYLSKPFHFKELLARINALTRRSNLSYQQSSQTYGVQDILVDAQTHCVTQNGQEIELSPREYKLLLYLLQHQGKVVSRTQILESVWGIQYQTNTNVVDVYISYLRNKIDESNGKLIHTIKGTGYMLQNK